MAQRGFSGLPWLEFAFSQMLSIIIFTATYGVFQLVLGQELELREIIMLGVASSFSSLIFTLVIFWAYRRKLLRSNPNFLVG